MFEISGGSKADRMFLESYFSAKKPEDKINEALTNFRRALDILPLAKRLIESESYVELCENIGEEIKDCKSGTEVISAWLDTEYKCRKMLNAHEGSAPLNSLSRVYSEWARGLGRLEGWYESISADLRHLRKTVLEPNKQKMWAIEILNEHIKDRNEWLDAEIKRIKRETVIEKVVNDVLEAKRRGQDYVAIPVTKDGKHYSRVIPVATFFQEESEPINLA